MVAVVARAGTARMILVVMAPLAGTTGVVSSPLVRSCGASTSLTCRSPVPGEVSPDQVENRG
jgi:hypothetical protein